MTGNNQPVDAERKMKLPNNPELPLFVYGIFKPGQLGFYQIEDLVEKCTPYKIPAKLYERDVSLFSNWEEILDLSKDI